MASLPLIPQYITVHMGPPDSPAQNITVPFPDYIKGVAFNQIYPTWPDNAIKAAVYAMSSFAMNRIYNNDYRSRGYDFDITNSPEYDQPYTYGGDIYDNIGRIIDEQFNSYMIYPGVPEPILATYCNGKTETCSGLSLWGAVELAQQGYTPYRILTKYYGDNLNIVTDVPISDHVEPYSGKPLAQGSSGNDVRRLQVMLNRVATNFPSIPNIYPVNGEFTQNTTDSVKKFQTLFNLKADGVVNNATWYRLAYFFDVLQRLSLLSAEVNSLEDKNLVFTQPIAEGQSGDIVRLLQLYLSYIGNFYSQLPIITSPDGDFGPLTKEAVIAFQKFTGLNPTGVVDLQTWNAIYKTFYDIVTRNPSLFNDKVHLFPGTDLTLNASGADVIDLQEYLSFIAQTYTEIPRTPVTGFYGPRTRDAVIAFQKLFGLESTGVTDKDTWNRIALEYANLIDVYKTNPGQYPGYILEEGQ